MNKQDGEALREFLSDAPHWDYLYGRLAGLKGVSPEVREALNQALGLMLIRHEPGFREEYGPFEPIFVSGNEVSALPPKEAGETTHRLWQEIVEETGGPVAVARFADLLWCVRYGDRPDHHARAAIDAYLELAGTRWSQRDTPEDGRGSHSWGADRRAQCLQRGLAITREIRDEELTQRVIGAIDSAVSQTFDSNNVGAFQDLTETLANLPRALRPQHLESMVRAALEGRFGGLYGGTRLFEIAAQLAAGDSERKTLREEQVGRWVEAADQASGLQSWAHLQRAIELARQYGVGDIAAIRRRLDSFTPDDFELKTISVPIEFSREELDEHVRSFVRPEGWQGSLRTFAIRDGNPPIGDHTENQAAVEEQASESPLQFLMPAAIIDKRGRTIRHVESDEDHYSHALIRHETLRASLFGRLAPLILDEIFNQHGRPTRSEIAAFFATDLMGEHIAERIARSVELFLDEYYDESAHMLAPRLEAVIRELALQTGVPVAREAVGEESGGVATLGSLLRGLSGRLDESWLRYLTNALVEPTGLNLRNRICHGLLDEADASDAAILLHIACFLTLLSLRTVQAERSPEA